MKEERFKAIIIDDEYSCIDRIKLSLSAYPEVTVVAVASGAESGAALIMEHKPDLVFTDVEMPRKSGFDMLAMLEGRISWPVMVVFCTAYEKYLITAIRASALDFLLKPYTDEEFTAVMKHFFVKIREAGYLFSMKQLVDKMAVDETISIMFPLSIGFMKTEVQRVVFFEYQKLKKMWQFTLSDGSKHELKKGLTSDSIAEFSERFVRINQYQLINIDYVSYVQTSYCILLPPFDEKLSIGRKYRDNIFSKLNLE